MVIPGAILTTITILILRSLPAHSAQVRQTTVQAAAAAVTAVQAAVRRQAGLRAINAVLSRASQNNANASFACTIITITVLYEIIIFLQHPATDGF